LRGGTRKVGDQEEETKPLLVKTGKNHVSAIIVVHFKKIVRKGFCAEEFLLCKKTVLGKVSACKKIGVYFFFCAVCMYNFLCVDFFRCQKMCVKIVLCKGFSVAKGSVCKSAYAPFFYVRKNIFVQSIGM